MVGKMLWRFSSAICFNSCVAFCIKKISTDFTVPLKSAIGTWTGPKKKNISKPIMVAGTAATWIKGECNLKMSCNCSCPANLSSVATESILIRIPFNPFISWHELILFQGEGGPSLMTILYIFIRFEGSIACEGVWSLHSEPLLFRYSSPMKAFNQCMVGKLQRME